MPYQRVILAVEYWRKGEKASQPRTPGHPKMTPTQVQYQMEKDIPLEIQSAFHIYLIHHGRKLCKARNPHCIECPILEDCKKVGV
jgi:endonuclease III